MNASPLESHRQLDKVRPPFVVIPNVFSAAECKEIISACEESELAQETVGDGISYEINQKARDVLSCTIERAPEHLWIYSRMDIVFFKLAEFWGLDVEETVEQVKYLRY
jgi:hypothetical protein